MLRARTRLNLTVSNERGADIGLKGSLSRLLESFEKRAVYFNKVLTISERMNASDQRTVHFIEHAIPSQYTCPRLSSGFE